MYSCNYPKLSNKFIKQDQISDYVISRESELSIGPQSQELSLSEKSMLNWLSYPFLVFLRLVIIVILGDLKILLVNGHYIHFYEKIDYYIHFCAGEQPVFLYPLKTSENQWFYYVFSGYRKRSVAWNGLGETFASKV